MKSRRQHGEGKQPKAQSKGNFLVTSLRMNEVIEIKGEGEYKDDDGLIEKLGKPSKSRLTWSYTELWLVPELMVAWNMPNNRANGYDQLNKCTLACDTTVQSLKQTISYVQRQVRYHKAINKHFETNPSGNAMIYYYTSRTLAGWELL